MTPDRWLSLPYDQFPPEQQPDGSWVYEANPHGHGLVHYVDGPVLHFAPYGHGFGVAIEPVGVPPPLVNDSYGA